jgi:SfnB family sulfur acquisition oxidoreductase
MTDAVPSPESSSQHLESPETATQRAPTLNAAGALAAATRFADEIGDGVIQRDRDGSLPVAELAAFDASGLLGITVPPEHGGAGLGMTTLAEVARTVAAVDPAVAQGPQAHYLMADVLVVAGSDVQRARLLGDVVAGRRIASALAERGGAHAQDLKVRLRRDGDRLTLDGRKYYATGALTAHWLAVSAVDDEERLVLVFVPRAAPGVTLTDDWNVMGQRATVSGSVVFDAAEIEPELVVPYGELFTRPQQLGARAQLYHAAIQVGIAGGVLRDARWFVTEKARPFFEATRAGWADTAAEDPHVIHRFGELATRVRAAEALLADTARVLDSIGVVPADEQAAARGSIAVAQAKAFASETAVSVSSDLFSLSGASAADEKYDLSRHWRNARTHASHDPVDWKYHHVGDFLLRDVLPPNHAQL